MATLVTGKDIRTKRGASKDPLTLDILAPLMDKVDEDAALVFIAGKDFHVTPNTFERNLRDLDEQLPVYTRDGKEFQVRVSVSATRDPDNPTKNLDKVDDPSGAKDKKGNVRKVFPKPPAVVAWLRSAPKTDDSAQGEDAEQGSDDEAGEGTEPEPTDVVDLGQDPHVDPDVVTGQGQQAGASAWG